MKESYNLSTEGMQELGKHYMGNHIKHDINKEDLEKAKEIERLSQIKYVENLLSKDKDCKPYSNKELHPCNATVIIKPYEKNPYRVPLTQKSSGLIIGDFETTASYKSQETGEVEASKRGIWCCQIIAVGPECKNVSPGDDAYVNFMIAMPVPFGDYGYYAISEQNILCSIKLKENE